MSFLNGLSGDFLKRLSGGNMNPAQPNDQRDMGQLMGGVPQEDFQQHATNALSQVDPQEYQAHITPGVGGTNPLGGLGKGMLGSLAGSLIGNMLGGQMGGGMGRASPVPWRAACWAGRRGSTRTSRMSCKACWGTRRCSWRAGVTPRF